MSRNSGIDAQNEFESIWKGFGYAAMIHRFPDTADVTRERAARTGRSFAAALIKIPEQPADFLIANRDGMAFAEVKSISSMRFNFSNVRRAQANMGVRVSKFHDSLYQIFIRCELNKKWWCVPFFDIVERAGRGDKSIDLAHSSSDTYKWERTNAIY